ncbi:MAG: T9SS type A sorting domain-containing protein [Bacteroidetes bacterium]|nr:T9SS type A sorting domain-containing protein [Bacteroidota bacterium]
MNHRWASSVIAVSSEYGSVEWGAIQLLGAPDVYPNYGDIESSWSPGGWDDPDEYFELGYTHPIPINYIDIYETFGPGTVDSVYVKNPGTGLFELVYSATPQYAGDTATILHITFPMTTFPVSEIRVSLETAAVEGWNDFDAVGIGNDLPNSYSWSTGDTLATLNVSTSGTYSVSITNSIGCTSSSEPLEITVNPLPVVTIGSDMYTGVCSSSFLLSGGIPAGGTYNGIGVSNNEFDPTIGPGSYAIEYSYTDSNGCSSSASNQITVTDAPVTTLNSFQNICSDAAPFTLTGGSPTGGTYFGTGVSNGMFDPSIGSGTYQINYIFEDSLGCSTVADQQITVELCLGLSDDKLDRGIFCYPNPANEKVVVNTSLVEKFYTIEIFNSIGSKVYSESLQEINDTHSLEIDLHQFPAGSYILRVATEIGITNKKLMIEK